MDSETDPKLTGEQFRASVRELAAVAGRELVWTAAQAVTQGFLANCLSHADEWIVLAERADRPPADLIAEGLIQSLRTYFEHCFETDLGLAPKEDRDAEAQHKLAEKIVRDLGGHGLLVSGHRDDAIAIVADGIAAYDYFYAIDDDKLVTSMVDDLEVGKFVVPEHREAITKALTDRIKGWTNLGVTRRVKASDLDEEIERRCKDTPNLRFMVQGTAAEVARVKGPSLHCHNCDDYHDYEQPCVTGTAG